MCEDRDLGFEGAHGGWRGGCVGGQGAHIKVCDNAFLHTLSNLVNNNIKCWPYFPQNATTLKVRM